MNGIIVDEGDEGLWKVLIGGVSMDYMTGPHFPNDTTAWTAHNSPEQLFLDCGEACLWRIDQDPTENEDLSKDPANLERIQKMKTAAEAANATTFSPNRGTTDRLACTTAQGKWGNFWGPFLP